MTTSRITDLLSRHPLVDGHNDLLWELRTLANYDLDAVDVAGPVARTQTDIPRLRAGGVGAQFWSVWVPCELPPAQAVTATLEQIDAGHALIERYATDFGLAATADDIEKIFASGRIASLFGAEGGHSIGNSLATLRTLYALGVRYLTLTHEKNTDWADAATDEPAHGGLTAFGVEVVREMNRMGMLVDISHVAPSTMDDALDATEAPLVFSHSSARAVCDHVRNVPDPVLARMPANGGVVMVTFVPPFLTDEAAEWGRRYSAERERRGVDLSVEGLREMSDWLAGNPRPVVTAKTVADHVEHVREVAGVAHVGIGGDYDGYPLFPDDMPDVAGYPALFAELADRGWSDGDLVALAGGNLIRTLRDAEAVARDLQARRGPSRVRIEDVDS
ncbi:dipeptidase [Fodinicola acaciae]|uniref:dipeptidase n=1 Tax=Fodinicola acaciae TaxID=2681555 RepID=UPI0013D681D2|nr:dipeptidase [Fodinicola acaciae]